METFARFLCVKRARLLIAFIHRNQKIWGIKEILEWGDTKNATHQLRELESDRLVNRKICPVVPPKGRIFFD